MPLETLDWIRSLKAIELEYRVASLAMRRLADEARRNPTILDRELRFRGIGDALGHLSGTYVIRLFAEFETALRRFWIATRREDEPRGIAEVVDRIASRYGIGDPELANAHRARRYRNRQIHDNREEGEAIEVSDCRSYLNHFLGRLPLTWTPPSP